jgi:hypothetical protein
MIKKYLKHIYYFLKGQTINPTVQVDLNAEWYGNSYGGFYVYPEVLDKESIIYSFGISEDISFDLAFINKHNC